MEGARDARAYEAAAPATLRAFVRFLQDEEASSQAEGDSPVGEPIGASVEIVTVHKAKGLEYPIVIVADLFTDRLPAGDCIIDHAARQGWLKIGKFQPDGWEERSKAEALQQDAEGRRLLYVALTRARDHLVIPCLPGEHGQELARARREHARPSARGDPVWQTREERDVVRLATSRLRRAGAHDAQRLDSRGWLSLGRCRKRSLRRKPGWRTSHRSEAGARGCRADCDPVRCAMFPLKRDESASTGAQRLYGSEAEGELAELSQTSGAVAAADDEPAVFGRYVHEILATVDLSGADVEPVARTLARRYGVTDANTARAIEMVERVLRLPLMDDARAATKIFREVPLAGNAAAGRAQGKADLLFEREGSGGLSTSRRTASMAPTRCGNTPPSSPGIQPAWHSSEEE